MELYVSRSGAVEGPHSVEKIQSLLREGILAPTDLGAPPGAADWSPLSQLVDCSAIHPVAKSTPPPISDAASARYLDQPFLVDGKFPSGTLGKSVRQILDEIALGGRLVVYPYVFSIIVMSFRRSSPIIYVPPGRSGAGTAFGWSIISMCLGWWGFPWGIVFTIGALWRNSGGGVDVTEPILAQIVGPAQADAMVRRRPKYGSGLLLGMRAVFLSPVLILPALFLMAVFSAPDRDEKLANQPGYKAFRQAESFVGSAKETSGRGNTPEATKAAQGFSKILQSFRTESITSKSGDTAPATRVATWCEAHPDRCVFIVEVPDLRNFTAEAKNAIADAAWLSAQVGAKELGLPATADLAVAIRGAFLYDRILMGNPAVGFSHDAPDADSILKKSIRDTKKGNGVDGDLIHYFVSPSA